MFVNSVKISIFDPGYVGAVSLAYLAHDGYSGKSQRSLNSRLTAV